MECNKDEVIKAIEIAERNLKEGDFEGAKKLALKASDLFPGVDENILQLLTVCQVHCAAQNNLNDSDRDWYGILQVEGLSDESSIRKQYRKLALLLHPDKNKYTGAEEAFKLIGEANAVLLDSRRKVSYDSKYRACGGRCSDSEETFWTYCDSCNVKFKYYRRNLNKQMTCKVCSQTFVAKDLDAQPSEKASEQPVATGFEDLYHATFRDELEKSCGAKGKRKARREEEKVVVKGSRKSNAKQNSEPAESMGSRRRSLRKKSNVSYNEDLYDDDIADLIESSNASTSGPGREHIEEQDKSYEASKASNVPIDSGSAMNLKTSSVAEIYKLPDPEFSDFDKERDEKAFAVNQIWACYDSVDGMPRFYARIRKVLSPGFSVKLTWLDPSPEVESVTSWANVLPVGCGRFQDGMTEVTSDRLTFSHQVKIDKCTKTGAYHVYPRRGETWALFKNWDIEWSSNPEGHKPFSYDVVEIFSDLHQVIGIDVCYLSKVEGFVSLFKRVAKDGTVTHLIPPNELLRFSHRVPSNKLTGAEREGVPVESFELDPAALLHITAELVEFKEVSMDTQTSTEKLNQGDEEAEASARVHSTGVDDKRSKIFESFHDFENDKGIQNFRCGQIWAIYSRKNRFPTCYGEIKKVEPLKLHVGLLESCLSQENRVCGMFQVSPEKSEIYTPSSFSHIMDVEKITNSIFEIYPRKGQVWAVYKNWGAGKMLKGNEKHEIVEVCKSNENCIDVWLLEHFSGTRSVFKHQKGERMHRIVMNIPRYELQRFCHQIPAFKLTGQKDGFLRGFWELDPAAVPHGVYRDKA